MIASLVIGTGVRGAINYLLRAGKPEREGEARIIGGNMAGRAPRELATEFGLFRRLRPQLSRAVFHASLSSAPTDRPLSDAEWTSVGERFLRELGFDDTPFLVVKHDKASHSHEHVHLLTVRVSSKGKTISDSGDYRRAENILRRIERDYRLCPVASSRAQTPEQPQQRRAIMNEKQKQAITERLEGAADYAEAQMLEMQGRDVNGADCADDLKATDSRSLRRILQTEEFEQTLRCVFGNEEIRHIHRVGAGGGIVVYMRGRARISCSGDKITAFHMDPELAAKRAVELAVILGWRRISFRGSTQFVTAAIREAIAQNIVVVPVTAAQEAILKAVLAESRGGGFALTPHPTAGAALPAAPVPQLKPVRLPEQPEFPLPSIFGDEIQRKLDARRRQEESQRFQPAKEKEARRARNQGGAL